MGFTAETGEPAAGVDGADVRTDGLEGREGAALSFDFADDVLTDAAAEVRGRAGEPAAFLVQEVGGDALGFLEEVLLVGFGLVELGDGLVDFLAADVGGGFEAVGGVEFAARGLLSLHEFAEEDVPVREGFFDDEGVVGVVVEGVGESGGFRGALGGVVVAGRLDGAAELFVRARETGVGFLGVHLVDFDAEVGFREAESCVGNGCQSVSGLIGYR